ncbi:Hpt domain-containing protein [Gymnodinialimonas sp. 2305UL16-5]|uniref:Hpt domain-containing protein n=1 Tax=Gymnodinialimonas mytili TaxID=3126503 RepID=UPI0030AA6C9E
MDVVDWDRLNELKSDIGEEDFADVAMLFVSELTEHLDRLTAAPDAASAEDFHFLRGSAANLGFLSLVKACSIAESACISGQPVDLVGVRTAFDAAMAEVSPKMPELSAAA